MAAKKWHPRPQFEGMTSWFDHDFIANGCEKDLEQVLDFEEQNGTYVVEKDQPDH